MIDRYSRPHLKAIWEPARKYETWLKVELLACEALAKKGLIPPSAVKQIRARARIKPARIEALERVTKHDVIAFLESISEQVGPAARYLHMGLTSSDILDTSLAVLMVEAADAILGELDRLLAVLRTRALEHRDTLMIGRSHGIHGEPITFGIKLAIWYDETRRHRERVHAARQGIAYGKVSGAMGTFAHLSPDVEAYVCKNLGLMPAPASSQIVQRDRHAAYLSALALLAASIEKFATEIRHLQRTEVREAEEYFSTGQKGSSAMPHKRNPITCEQICGLARVVRANAQAAFENVALWHERDISHSSVERVILPDSTILADYLLDKTAKLVDQLVVYPERMRRNLDLTKGLVFSGQLLLDLAAAGMLREQAYRLVQTHAMRAWEEESDFRAAIEADPEIRAIMSPEQIAEAFSLERQLRNVDKIFARVFGVS